MYTVLWYSLAAKLSTRRKPEWVLSYLEKKLACHIRGDDLHCSGFDCEAFSQVSQHLSEQPSVWSLAAIEKYFGAKLKFTLQCIHH